jgi:hypothetical protein
MPVEILSLEQSAVLPAARFEAQYSVASHASFWMTQFNIPKVIATIRRHLET